MPSRKFSKDFIETVLDLGGEDASVPDDCMEVAQVEGNQRRWHRDITTVFGPLDGKFYGVKWRRGLTESQENEYPWEFSEADIECAEFVHAEVTEKRWIPSP